MKGTEGFETRLRAANDRLSRCALVKHAQRLYIRSSHWPAKPGSQSKRPELATGYRATLKELTLAEGMAAEIDGQLLRERFSWEEWLKPKEAPAATVGDWLDKFERNYWQHHERTLNTENTYRKCYRLYFSNLPLSVSLNEDLLIDTLIERYKSGKRSRQLCAMAYGALSEFAELPRSRLIELGKGYRIPSKSLKNLPNDVQIEFAIDNCENRPWQWAAAMQATFGLRNHEIFRLDTKQIGEGVVTVGENSKTGARQVYACPFEWVERWQLQDICLPAVDCSRANNAIGSSVSQAFKRYGLHRPYQYRDGYAVRLKMRGIDSAFSSRWMGHSAAVHDRNYLSAIQDAHHQEIFEQRIKDAH